MRLKRACTLRDGAVLTLASLRPEDSGDVLRVCRQASGETLNLMRYPDEWKITDAREAEMLRNAEDGPRSLMLGAFLEGTLIGVGSLMPVANPDRVRHRAELGVTVLKAYWHRGVGGEMLRALIAAAQGAGLEQLELEVVSTNERAIRLYTRCGFERYGLLPRAFKYREGGYADLLLMRLALHGEG